MSKLPSIVGALAAGVVASIFAEGMLHPVLEPLFRTERDAVVVNWFGDAAAVLAGLFAYVSIEARRKPA